MIPYKQWVLIALNEITKHIIQILISHFDLIILTLIDICFFNET